MNERHALNDFRFKGCIWEIVFLAHSAIPLSAQRVPELPHKVSASARGTVFTVAHTVRVGTANRDDAAPEPQDKREKFRKAAERSLKGTSLTVVASSAPADFSLQLVMAPSVRYGQFHYDTAPYDYILLRDDRNGEIVYCAYERLMVLRSASFELLNDLRRTLTGTLIPPGPEKMQDCAEQAHAPLVTVIR